MTRLEVMVRHDTADQVGEDPTAGADEARAYRDFLGGCRLDVSGPARGAVDGAVSRG